MSDVTKALSQMRADSESMDRALEGFLERAVHEGLVEVAYSTVSSPIGRLTVAGTNAGLAWVSFEDFPLEQALEELSRRLSPRVLEAPARLDQVRRELDEYFEGRRHRFEVAVDLSLVKGFRRRVLEAAKRIPYGGVSTYTNVAERAGNARAVRAAGSALGANPVPIVVPCHRVLRRDGTLGGYGGGLPRKEFLLGLESGTKPVAPPRGP